MKQSNKLSNALHILIYLELSKNTDTISSSEIAESIATNPGVVRRLMSQLKKAGLITTQMGVAKPRLSKAPSEITLYEVFKAVEDGHLLRIDENINENCPIGKEVPNVMDKFFRRVEAAADTEMQKITLEAMIADIHTRME